jgi:hypothetical protein
MISVDEINKKISLEARNGQVVPIPCTPENFETAKTLASIVGALDNRVFNLEQRLRAAGIP